METVRRILNSMNGWKRLWLVCALIWLAVLAIYTSLNLPSQLDFPTPRIATDHNGGYSKFVDGEWKPIDAETYNQLHAQRLKEKVEARNGRLMTLGIMVGVWAVMVTVVYVLGAAIGWIYRGFRGTR